MKKILLFASAILLLQPMQNHAAEMHSPVYAKMVSKSVSLQISFISKGAGIDHESFDKIEAYLKDHPKKPSYTVNTFGKEGEKNIFVSLDNLSKKEQKALEKDIQNLIGKKDLVTIKKVKKIRAKY